MPQVVNAVRLTDAEKDTLKAVGRNRSVDTVVRALRKLLKEEMVTATAPLGRLLDVSEEQVSAALPALENFHRLLSLVSDDPAVADLLGQTESARHILGEARDLFHNPS